jgi:hypothetical protein
MIFVAIGHKRMLSDKTNNQNRKQVTTFKKSVQRQMEPK